MWCTLFNKVESEMRIAQPWRRHVLSECLLLLSGTTLASRGSCQLNSQGVKHSLLDRNLVVLRQFSAHSQRNAPTRQIYRPFLPC